MTGQLSLTELCIFVNISAFLVNNGSVEISLFQSRQWSLSFSSPHPPPHTRTHAHTLADTCTLAVTLILMVINDITSEFEGWTGGRWGRGGGLHLFAERTVGTGGSPGWRVRGSNNTHSVAFHPNTQPSPENTPLPPCPMLSRSLPPFL